MSEKQKKAKLKTWLSSKLYAAYLQRINTREVKPHFLYVWNLPIRVTRTTGALMFHPRGRHWSQIYSERSIWRQVYFDKLNCFSICISWDLWSMWTRNPLVKKQGNLPEKSKCFFSLKVYHYYFSVSAPCFKIHTQGWSGGSGVMITGWSSRGSSFKSQNPQGGSKVTYTCTTLGGQKRVSDPLCLELQMPGS